MIGAGSENARYRDRDSDNRCVNYDSDRFLNSGFGDFNPRDDWPEPRGTYTTEDLMFLYHQQDEQERDAVWGR